MLGFFPRPGNDELLYSVVARYGAMTGQGVSSQLIQDFFGTSVGVAAVDLPSHLDELVSRLPPGHSYDCDRLIEGHTLFPYLLRFAPEVTTARVRGYMANRTFKRPGMLGVMSAAFPARKRMMMCASCAREDSASLGMATWRRVHQLPGVLVCPRHDVALSETSVKRLERRGRGGLMPLTPEIRAGARKLSLPRGAKDSLLRFAHGSDDLLQSTMTTCDVEAFQRRLRGLLADFHWSRAPSLIHTAALVDAFSKHPVIRPLMIAIEVEWSNETLATAVNRLLYRETVAKHPLMVLMALELAGASFGDLMAVDPVQVADVPRKQAVTRQAPAVRHDLPCGNPACGRFLGHLSLNLPQLAGVMHPVRAVCQECSYAYLLDRRRPGGMCVVETGPLWDRLLAKTLAEEKIGVRAAGRVLGVSPTTVMRHARRLGLWREEWKDRPKVCLRRETIDQRLLERHRAAWVEFRSTEVSVPAKSLPKAAFNAYRYLIRKDRNWLERNHPLIRVAGSASVV